MWDRNTEKIIQIKLNYRNLDQLEVRKISRIAYPGVVISCKNLSQEDNFIDIINNNRKYYNFAGGDDWTFASCKEEIKIEELTLKCGSCKRILKILTMSPTCRCPHCSDNIECDITSICIN